MKQQLIRALTETEKHIGIYRCPTCGSGFSAVRGTSLYCEKGHCFDFSADGYINFLTSPVSDKYGADLYTARRQVMLSGVYASLRQCIKEALSDTDGPVLDAGAGEGALTSAAYKEGRGLFGIDISKNGIKRAARDIPGLWAVGDIAKMPYADEAFGAVMNVLSPANYSEFARVLKIGGTLLKVVPGREYLKELRAAAGLDEYKESGTRDIFYAHTEDVHEYDIHETHEPGEDLMKSILAMSPIGWHGKGSSLPERITVDLTVLTGKIKN